MSALISGRYAIRMVGVLTLAGLLLGADWPNWLGPNHDGISSEKGFKVTWQGSPKVLWEHAVGSGFSAFACVGGKVYTCGTKDKQQVLFCFDAQTGKLIWDTPIEQEFKDRSGGDGTRATPAVNDGRVYQLGARGTLLCVDAKTGDQKWRMQFSGKPNWGYAGSVLIEGKLAIVSPGGSDGALLALDKETGKEVWKCASDPAAYGSPYPFTFNKQRYIVGFMAKAAIIADAQTGQEMGRIPWETSYDVNASSPIYHDGHLYLGTAYGTGCALFKLSAKGGKLAADEVWRSKVLQTKFRSCVLTDGVLYTGDEEGLKCVEFMTGKLLWKVDHMNHASVVLADNHLIVLTEKGQLQTAKATPKEYKPIAKADLLSGRCWTVPTLYDGKLYLRNLEKAVCLDLR